MDRLWVAQRLPSSALGDGALALEVACALVNFADQQLGGLDQPWCRATAATRRLRLTTVRPIWRQAWPRTIARCHRSAGVASVGRVANRASS